MWSRRQLLGALGASALTAPLIGRSQTAPPAHKVVLVWANGGWDSTFCFDPKLGVGLIEGPEVHATGGNDVEEIQTFGTDLQIVVNDVKRPSVRAFFEDWGHAVAVVNGISTGSVAHDPSRLRVLTGNGVPGRADVSVISGSIHGAALPLGSMDLSGYSLAGPLSATAGRIGNSSQLKALVDPYASFDAPKELGSRYPLFVPALDEQQALRGFVEARTERMRARRGGADANDQKLDDLIESMLRAERVADSGADAIDQLKIGSAPGYLPSMPLAVDFLAKGLCSSVFLDSAARWDTHTNNVQQHDLFDKLFSGLSELARLLTEAGIFEETTVIVMSEMTRTPRINAEAGKDHWPYASAMVMGPTVIGGHAYGGTNDLLEGLAIDFASGEVDPSGRVLQYDTFAASLLALLDIDPVPWYGDIPVFTGWRA